MQLTKYKITSPKAPGYMMVIYQDNHFKSILNEFKPPLTDQQLAIILKRITDDPAELIPVMNQHYAGQIIVEPVKAIGAEPETATMPDYAANDKIALWCRLYAEYTKDEAGTPMKYKTGAAEAGKIKALAVAPEELEFVLHAYFKSVEWFTVPKSISNLVKKYNEIRALAYAAPVIKKKSYPLPFDAVFFGNCSTNEQRQYWDHLRVNGYKWIANPGRGGKWEKVYNI